MKAPFLKSPVKLLVKTSSARKKDLERFAHPGLCTRKKLLKKKRDTLTRRAPLINKQTILPSLPNRPS